MVQWLGFHASTAGVTGSIPGGGTKIPHATLCGQKKKKKKKPEGEKTNQKKNKIKGNNDIQ